MGVKETLLNLDKVLAFCVCERGVEHNMQQKYPLSSADLLLPPLAE